MVKNTKDQTYQIDQISFNLDERERKLITHLNLYPVTISQAADQYSPAIIANYLYELVKTYNTFYQNLKVHMLRSHIKKNSESLYLERVGYVIKKASSLLGINLPETM